MSMRVLVTGGFGFLGRHLIDELLTLEGVEIVASDLQGSPSLHRERVRYVGGVDILDPASIGEAVRGADAVIHLAGLVSFRASDRARLYEVNQIGTRRVAEACARARVRRLVHVSSVAALGYNDREDAPVDETHEFDWSSAQGKHYMLSKRAAEGELTAAATAGVSVVIANPGLMYGPGDRTNLGLFRAVWRKQLPVVFPGGTNVVDVRDVARGLRLMLTSGHRNERFILGGQNIRFTEIVRTMARVMGVSTAPLRAPLKLHATSYRTFQVIERLSSRSVLTSDHVDSAFRFRYFSSAKAARLLGWRARIPFARTIADSLAEMRSAGLLTGAA
jgi:dihydroflavonol-4-reductase